MKSKVLKIVLMVLCLGIIISVDQITKSVATDTLKGHEPISLLNNTVVLTYALNEGAFLGMFSGFPKIVRTITLVILPIIACIIGLLYLIIRNRFTLVQTLLLTMVIAGGIGNLVDRLLAGRVVDFLNFGIGSLRTGILNVADMAVTFGIIIFVIVYSISNRKKKTSAA